MSEVRTAPIGWMATEIAEQPQVLAESMHRLWPVRARLAELAAGRSQVLFSARGSSDNAALYGRYLCELHAGVSAGLLAPSVATHYAARLDLRHAVVVSVSQSGATEEIVATQRWARSCGAATVAITNAAGSALATEADVALVTHAGPERAVPATKTYTSQLLAMAVLAQGLAPSRVESLESQLGRAPDAVADLVAQRSGIEAAAELLRPAQRVVTCARGVAFGSALEVGLKLEETCLRPVRGLSYADLRHGPIAAVDESTVAVLIAAGDGPVLAGMIEVAAELRGRGASLIGIGGDAALAEAVQVAVPGPVLPELTSPLGLVVPGQLIAERLARMLRLDPDNPRGLHKVTQTDPDDSGAGEQTGN